MGKPIIICQDGLRVLIDPDDHSRRPSPVIEYKMSPEEIQARYGRKNKYRQDDKKPVINTFQQIKEKREADIMKTKITKDQLIEECRKSGFTKESYIAISEKYGLVSYHSVASLVHKYKLKALIEAEASEKAVSPE